MEKPQNPPAFPNVPQAIRSVGDADSVGFWAGFPGMTLLDYFAAKAMQSLIINRNGTATFEEIAGASYVYAQAMLKEREKYL